CSWATVLKIGTKLGSFPTHFASTPSAAQAPSGWLFRPKIWSGN
ncbi:hypothetical protein AAKU67_002629, partial [Oxalobacteraceae bacterium GrIS 2.11]